MSATTTLPTRSYYATLLPEANTVERIGPYIGIIARSAEQKLSAYRLRHQVYCDELAWQPTHVSGFEMDQHDRWADLVCVLNPQGDVIATIRLLNDKDNWLVDECFSETLTTGTAKLKYQGCVEASRLAISEQWRSVSINASNALILDLLLITLINYAWEHLDKRSVLITTTPLMGVTLKRRGIAIEQQGPIITMADNCKVATFLCDLEVTRDQYRHYQHYMQQRDWNNAQPSSCSYFSGDKQ